MNFIGKSLGCLKTVALIFSSLGICNNRVIRKMYLEFLLIQKIKLYRVVKYSFALDENLNIFIFSSYSNKKRKNWVNHIKRKIKNNL